MMEIYTPEQKKNVIGFLDLGNPFFYSMD